MNTTKNYEALTVGTQLFYTGDVCNLEGTCTIDKVVDDKWGRMYQLTVTDCSGAKRGTVISPAQIGPPANHSGFRFQVLAERKAWRAEQMKTYAVAK